MEKVYKIVFHYDRCNYDKDLCPSEAPELFKSKDSAIHYINKLFTPIINTKYRLEELRKIEDPSPEEQQEIDILDYDLMYEPISCTIKEVEVLD